MADTVTSQTIEDTPHKLVMKFTNTSDGSGESAVKKVDVSAFTAGSRIDSTTVSTCTDADGMIFFAYGATVYWALNHHSWLVRLLY